MQPQHDSASRGAGHDQMAKRGVTAPSAEMMEHHAVGESSGQHEQPAGGGGMGKGMRRKMLARHHAHTQWVYWSILLLGVWSLLAPVTFGYGQVVSVPSGGRQLWLSDAARVAAARWSDVISGVLLVVLGWRSLKPERPVSLWLCCLVGVWMTFAPVVFWAPSPAAYYNSTLVGMLVMALSVLVPGMPAMIGFMKMGGNQPPGWSYNPSSWAQRLILIGLAFGGFLTSRYLAAYQLGYIATAWDPFFGDATRKVLDSEMSRSLPISDGALGALAYTFEFLMGWMGSPSRWRTMPWMVTFFGVLVIPLGLVHVALVVSQPVVVGHWCTFCLLAAGFMLPMIPLAVDEVVAMCQHMARSRRRGEAFWSVFWKGGSAEGSTKDQRTPTPADFPEHAGAMLRAGFWGMTFPWNLTLSAALGVALMATPGLLQIPRPASAIFHLGGSVATVVAVVVMSEPIRMGRYLNVLVGLGIAGGIWMLGAASTAAHLLATAGGLAVAALCLPRGSIRERFGSWDRRIR